MHLKIPWKQTLWSKTQTEVQFTFENKTLKMLFIHSLFYVRHPPEKSYQNNILRHYFPSTVLKKFSDFNAQKPFSEVVRNLCFAWIGLILASECVFSTAAEWHWNEMKDALKQCTIFKSFARCLCIFI